MSVWRPSRIVGSAGAAFLVRFFLATNYPPKFDHRILVNLALFEEEVRSAYFSKRVNTLWRSRRGNLSQGEASLKNLGGYPLRSSGGSQDC